MGRTMKCPHCYEISSERDILNEEPSGLQTVWYHCPLCGAWSPEEDWVIYDNGIMEKAVRYIAKIRAICMDKNIPFESQEKVNAYFEKQEREYKQWLEKEVEKTPADCFREWGL